MQRSSTARHLRAIGLLVAALCSVACASGPAIESDGGATAPVLRVGTSGDYAPYSLASDAGEITGIDADTARAYGLDRGVRVEFVRFRWPELVDDLRARRFDVAMSGVTVRPERSLAGLFSVPVDSSGAVALVRDDGPQSVAALDRLGRRIVVNRGGHLERVARKRFPHAEIVALANNRAVLARFLEADFDAAITDTREAPHWRARAPGLRVLGPFSRDRKAYLVGADQDALAADLNTWLLASAADGSLDTIRARYEEPAHSATRITAPLPAVLAAIDERLALMPWVAEVKRRDALPVEVPEREARVLAAAVAAVHAAATRERPGDAGRQADDSALRALFHAQIEAAKAIQRGVIAQPPADRDDPLPDLDKALRPALIRIGNRIAELVVVLPRDLEPEHVRTETRDALAARGLEAAHVDGIANALITLTSTPDADAEDR